MGSKILRCMDRYGNKVFGFLESHKKQAWILAALAWLFAMLFISDGDYEDFLSYWIRWMDADGLSGAYGHSYAAEPLRHINYPPLYLAYLYLMREPMLYAAVHGLPGYFFARVGFAAIHFGFSGWLYWRVDRRLSWFWLLNPGFFINMAAWSQMDGTLCMLTVLMLLGMKDNKSWQVYLSFGLACLLKMQGAMLLPLLLYYVYANRQSWKKELPKLFLAGAACLSAYVPFIMRSGIQPVLDLYFVGAGRNWSNMTDPVIFHGGYLFIAFLMSIPMYEYAALLTCKMKFVWYGLSFGGFGLAVRRLDVLPASALYLYFIAYIGIGIDKRASFYAMSAFMLAAVYAGRDMGRQYVLYAVRLLLLVLGGYTVQNGMNLLSGCSGNAVLPVFLAATAAYLAIWCLGLRWFVACMKEMLFDKKL